MIGSAEIMRTKALGNLRFQIRLSTSCQSEHFNSTQPQDQCTQQTDLSGTCHPCSLRFPNLQTLLSQKRLLHRLRRTTHRLRQHVQMLQSLWHPDDEFLVVHKVFRQKPMPQIDPALVIHLFTGDIRTTNPVINGSARTTNGAGHIVPGLHFSDCSTNLFHNPETLVTNHQKVVARRSIAVQSVVDLAIRCVHSDLQHPHKHSTAIRNVTHRRL